MANLCLISSVGVILILLPLPKISNLANFMWRMGFLGNISEVCIITLNLVANTIGTNLKQGILVYRYTFQHFLKDSSNYSENIKCIIPQEIVIPIIAAVEGTWDANIIATVIRYKNIFAIEMYLFTDSSIKARVKKRF